jgi:anti-sigma B factor antagonist
MNLQLHQREKEGIQILDLQGPLTIGDSEALLRAAVVASAEVGTVNIVLNFSDVTELDDDGLGALVFCYARIQESGGGLKLLSLPLHLSLMILTKLDTVFEVFSDEQDAINSFFPGRATRRYDLLEWVEEEEDSPSAGLPG